MDEDADHKSLVERVQDVAHTLTDTEQRLISELLKAPREIALGTSSEFAARLNVHEATTSRLSRKLGFATYAQFRAHLRDEFLRSSAPASRISATLSESRRQGFLPLLIDQEMAALGAVSDHVTDEQIVEAASMLDRARVFIYGHGNAETLVLLMERRLRRLGIVTLRLTGNRRDLAEQMLTLGRDDAVLMFAFRRQPPDYSRIMDVARDVMASTVTVSGTIGPSLQPKPDLLLSAPRAGSRESYQTLTVPMALCNAVVLALADRRGPDALAKLDRLGALITQFGD
ncbi:MurR/RpiR family transcriptional regulator [Shinella sp. CPCC 100929]|uniref:MurR/RpiR family transcriptional regulator n=1 Tax=Shinella lacus TaxID=2654216 RepID=A0ABT1RED5_9HYPH|nr:MurR/RpiR family transcriptional regulator [Shinella lacus]MCQ4633558.1 MurR/RpiR family transcriptional regulator [Shinella lacus]